VSGIASLFRPAPGPVEDNSSRDYQPLSPTASNSLSPDPSLYSELAPPSGVSSPSLPTSPSSVAATGQPDPYFNPPFFNDVQFKDRGWFKNIAHFTKKHMDENLVSAATNHIMSHLEFGGCLADYPGMLSRYNRLRQLEDVDPFSANVPPGAPRPAKVRFVNYFTISTGRITKPKSRSPSPHLRPEAALANTTSHGSAGQRNSLDAQATNTTHGSGDGSQRNSCEAASKPSTPRISIEDHSDGGRPEILQLIDPVPEEEDNDNIDNQSFHSAAETPQANVPTTDSPSSNPDDTQTQTPALPADLHLPSIPDLPPQPSPPDLTPYASNPAARKLVEKEFKQARKAYDQAVKNRDKAVAERAKLVRKHHAKLAKDAEKERKVLEKREREELKRVQKEEAAAAKKEQADVAAAAAARERDAQQTKSGKEVGRESEKKKKERKFCMLPRKVNGVRDSAWVQVNMEGVDEVGAHCGLFFSGPHYERLVGDVGSRIVGWLQEDATRRAILELEDGVEGLDVD